MDTFSTIITILCTLLGELELENQSLKWHKCVVKGCGLRKPPRDIDEVNDEQNTIETEDVQRLAIQ